MEIIRTNYLTGKLTLVHGLNGRLSGVDTLNGSLSVPKTVEVKNYDVLVNKPKINSVTLDGNKTGSQLSLINTTDTMEDWEIDQIIYGGL